MSAQPYIQSALAELQSALTDIHQQIDGLRRQVDAEKHQVQHDIDQLGNQVKADEAAMSQQQDNSERHLFLEHIHHVNRNTDDMKARLNQLDHDLNNAIQVKTQAYNTLQNLIQQLDVFMASPDIR